MARPPAPRPDCVVSYLRVSTARQGRSGLGLEAQRATIGQFLASRPQLRQCAEYVEIESGRAADRPQLAEAIAHARRIGATIVIARLDRLTRDLHFLTSLQREGIAFVCADMPELDQFTIHLLGAFAQHEARLISQRTRAALAAAKRRGVAIGTPENFTDTGRRRGAQRNADKARRAYAGVAGYIAALRREGLPYAKVASRLNGEGIRTVKGAQFTPKTVHRIAQRAQ